MQRRIRELDEKYNSGEGGVGWDQGMGPRRPREFVDDEHNEVGYGID